MRGEIDIVALDKGTLVFVEVKTRHSEEFGSPLEAVHETKQAQLRKIASTYLMKRNMHSKPCRFDVIGILMKEKGKFDITHVKNAF